MVSWSILVYWNSYLLNDWSVNIQLLYKESYRYSQISGPFFWHVYFLVGKWVNSWLVCNSADDKLNYQYIIITPHVWEAGPVRMSILSMLQCSKSLVSYVMPWLCVDHMIQQGVWPMGFSYPDPLANLDPLAKSRPTDKIQTHW